MDFNKDSLKIKNIEEVSQKLQEFIKDQVFNKFKRRGAVIGISGGVDSAVTAALCVKALGKEKVLGLILPEKESNSKSKPYAEKLAEQLGIKTEYIDLTPILTSFKMYEMRDSIVKKNF